MQIFKAETGNFLGGASSTMCIQLIRNKLRRFHTQAAGGGLANFFSSITNFAQKILRGCAKDSPMHRIPMHGLAASVCASFCLMKCKSAGKVSAEKSWLRQLCGSKHHSSLSAEVLLPRSWRVDGGGWRVERTRYWDDVLWPDKTKHQQLRLCLTWLYIWDRICQEFFGAKLR